jgi:hypothetical protein
VLDFDDLSIGSKPSLFRELKRKDLFNVCVAFVGDFINKVVVWPGDETLLEQFDSGSVGCRCIFWEGGRAIVAMEQVSQVNDG